MKALRILMLVVALGMAVLPAVLYAQEEACVEARMDAQREVNTGMWFAIGFFLGVVGWLIAYVMEPSPPAAKLIGADPEYVAVYTQCYKAEAKRLQADAALKGCIVYNLLVCACYACYLGLLSSSTSY